MRHSENDIARSVAKFLSTQPNGEAPIPLIKEALPDYLNLAEEDLQPSPTRKGEALWEQQVRNIVSHRKDEGNWVCEGYLTYRPGFLTVTEKGRAAVAAQSAEA